MRIEPSDRAKAFALQFLDQFDGHISAEFLWESINRLRGCPSTITLAISRFLRCTASRPSGSPSCKYFDKDEQMVCKRNRLWGWRHSYGLQDMDMKR